MGYLILAIVVLAAGSYAGAKVYQWVNPDPSTITATLYTDNEYTQQKALALTEGERLALAHDTTGSGNIFIGEHASMATTDVILAPPPAPDRPSQRP